MKKKYDFKIYVAIGSFLTRNRKEKYFIIEIKQIFVQIGKRRFYLRIQEDDRTKTVLYRFSIFILDYFDCSIFFI